MKRASGRAPGKIILIGEHAVVYGHPAIAMPVRSVGAVVTAEFARDHSLRIQLPDLAAVGREVEAFHTTEAVTALAKKVLELFGEDSQGIKLTIHSDISMGAGMGSSAALCVATVRALCLLFERSLGDEQVADMALEGEKVFHESPSGIDSTVAALDQPIYYSRRKGAAPIAAGRTQFRFLVADTGIASSTAEVVADVRRARQGQRARYDALFWEIGSMASVAREVIRAGSRAELGMCMDRNQELLAAVGLSCAEADQLIGAAKKCGAAGAKVSGAGRGGNVLVLLGDETDETALDSALRSAGARSLVRAELAAQG